MSVRKRTWTILGGGVALALTVTAAGAAEEDRDSANFRLPLCRGFLNHSGANILLQGACAGVIEGMVFLGKYQCVDVPDEVTIAQAVRVVVAYIDARPARMHEPFKKLAIEALRAAWPCK
jgi:Rap1a immunity proteins